MIRDFLEGVLNTGDLVKDIRKLKPLPGMGLGAWIVWTATIGSLIGLGLSPIILYLFDFTTFAAWICSAAAVMCFGLVEGRRARSNFKTHNSNSWGRNGW